MKIRPVKKVELAFVSCHLFAVERSHQLVKSHAKTKKKNPNKQKNLTAEQAAGPNSLDGCNQFEYFLCIVWEKKSVVIKGSFNYGYDSIYYIYSYPNIEEKQTSTAITFKRGGHI